MAPAAGPGAILLGGRVWRECRHRRLSWMPGAAASADLAASPPDVLGRERALLVDDRYHSTRSAGGGRTRHPRASHLPAVERRGS